MDHESIRAWVEKAKVSIERHRRPILVCSNASLVGSMRMKALAGQGAPISSLAAMAFGQTIMGALWESMFNESGLVCAQVLLIQDDLDIDHRKACVQATLQTLLDRGVVPIISENQLSVVPPSSLGSGHQLFEAIERMMTPSVPGATQDTEICMNMQA